MCGVLGFSAAGPDAGFGARVIPALERMAPRGPDDAGYAWLAPGAEHMAVERADLAGRSWRIGPVEGLRTAQAVLGHTRFSIVELSRLGAQPMASPDGRLVLVFNGEIYNHAELRARLAAHGHVFRSHSDTEVLLHAYMEWGERCFEHLTGWWAIALHDADRGAILLARDRIGKAPLYLRRAPQGLAWASEIAALFALAGDGDASPNWRAVDDFVLHGLRDACDETLFKGVETLPAGAYAWVRDGRMGPPVRYWRLPQRRLTEKEISVPEAARLVRESLMEATRLRLQADVPVALQLSGGLDSSVVLACAARAGRRVQAITVSFPEVEANEDAYAAAAAAAFPGLVDHEFITPGDDITLEGLDDYLLSMGEPFHSPNQIANRLIWARLRELGYKVVLYGAGGDEVFAGYYGQYYIPHLRERLLSGDLAGFAKNLWDLSERPRTLPDLAGRLAILAPGGASLFDALRRGVVPWRSLYGMIGAESRFDPPWRLAEKLAALMGDQRMNYWLRTDNQNAMQAPVELRSPFLDHRVVETAFVLPTTYLIRDGWMKWIVRKAFEDDLPAGVVWRREKMGFPFPIRRWLKDNAAGVAERLVSAGARGVRTDRVARRLDHNIARNPDRVWRLLAYSTWWSRKGEIAGAPEIKLEEAVATS
jgi:asparagine synthase (glutamine-hydrolysing)